VEGVFETLLEKGRDIAEQVMVDSKSMLIGADEDRGVLGMVWPR
jgi:hypothetical protein